MSAEHEEPRILPMVRPRGLIESIVEEVLAARRDLPVGPRGCSVTIDVADRHVLQVDPAAIRAILTELVSAALDNAALTQSGETPVDREVVVTSVEYADTIEIEVADSGPVLPQAGAAHAEQIVQPLLEQVGGRLTAAACPEGGRALTLSLPHRRLRRRAA
jgi:C4-dicarboxylate-specific signal transduction histidine kinase